MQHNQFSAQDRSHQYLVKRQDAQWVLLILSYPGAAPAHLVTQPLDADCPASALQAAKRVLGND